MVRKESSTGRGMSPWSSTWSPFPLSDPRRMSTPIWPGSLRPRAELAFPDSARNGNRGPGPAGDSAGSPLRPLTRKRKLVSRGDSDSASGIMMPLPVARPEALTNSPGGPGCRLGVGGRLAIPPTLRLPVPVAAPALIATGPCSSRPLLGASAGAYYVKHGGCRGRHWHDSDDVIMMI